MKKYYMISVGDSVNASTLLNATSMEAAMREAYDRMGAGDYIVETDDSTEWESAYGNEYSWVKPCNALDAVQLVHFNAVDVPAATEEEREAAAGWYWVRWNDADEAFTVDDWDQMIPAEEQTDNMPLIYGDGQPRPVIVNGATKNMSYKDVCKDLGYIWWVHFVKIEPDGTISYTCGRPSEIRGLYHDCIAKGYKPSAQFEEVINGMV